MSPLVESDNGRTVDVRLHDPVRITLAENATSGYRWAIDRYDDALFDAISTQVRYPNSGLGSGGEVDFVFEAKKVGRGAIALKYWRHWEGDASIKGRFGVTLNVAA
jgi:inhibitor of cysteine peptidase